MSDNLRRSLLTIGQPDISLQPGLQTATECYTERFATIPPGMWYRYYQGQHWLTRSLLGPAFFLFLSRWQNVPEVGCFLGATVSLYLPHTSPSGRPTATYG